MSRHRFTGERIKKQRKCREKAAGKTYMRAAATIVNGDLILAVKLT
jgi:hypothetical protein